MGEITLICQSERAATAVTRSLSPDNTGAKGLKIKTSVSGKEVKTVIKASDLGTFLATVDDLLSCAQASLRALRVAK